MAEADGSEWRWQRMAVAAEPRDGEPRMPAGARRGVSRSGAGPYIILYDNIIGVLGYLVTSKARRRLLHILWVSGAEGSVRSLAAQVTMSFAAAHRELAAMRAAGLASSARVGGATVFRANRDHPLAGHLEALLRGGVDQLPTPDQDDADERVRSWLAALGAPLAVERVATEVPAVEEALAAGFDLAHRDPSVARALPVCIWRQRHRLDWHRLVAAARGHDEVQTLGFFTELAGTLAGDREMVRRARTVLDHRRRRPVDFFGGRPTARQLAAAERNTPPVARRWKLRMNMGMDAFRALFDKWISDAPVRA